MSLSKYVESAIITESQTSTLVTDVDNLQDVLNSMITAGNLLDVIKKDTFYGLPQDPTKQQIRATRLSRNAGLITKAALQTQASTQRRIDGDTSKHRTLGAVDPRIVHAIVGIATESVELLEALNRAIEDGTNVDTVNVLEEMFDTMWYILIAHDAFKMNPDDTLARGFAKLAQRYPDKFNAHHAHNRDIQTERDILEGKHETPN